MLLTLLLAVLDDAVGADARRAASHEVARRMGIGWRPEREARAVPPAFVSLIRMARAIAQAAQVRTSIPCPPQDEWIGRREYHVAVDFLNTATATWLSETSRYPMFRALFPFRGEVAGSYAFLNPFTPGLLIPAQDAPLLSQISLSDLMEHPERLSRHTTDPLFARLAEALDVAKTGPWDQLLWGVLPKHQAILEVFDWFTATHPPVDRMNWAEIVAAAETWHAAMSATEGFGGPVPDALVVLRWPNGVTLQRLLTKKDFAAEGASMGHCVGGSQDTEHPPTGESDYFRKTRDGHGAVYSLRAPNGVPAATFEVVYRHPFFLGERPRRTFALVPQIQGPEDADLRAFADEALPSAERDPAPYLLDALTQLRLIRHRFSTDTGDFGDLSVDAWDRLPSVISSVPDADEPPTWFPDLSPAARSAVLEAHRDGAWTTSPPEATSSFWARVALAPKADLVGLIGSPVRLPPAPRR